MDPSGVRLGTPAITTRGFDAADTCAVAKFIVQAIENHSDEAKLKSIRESILELCRKRPLYGF
jgi:glycine hydroxymethyltransferase